MRNRVLIHAHVFYLDIWPDLFSRIKDFTEVVGRDSVRIVATCPEGKDHIVSILANDLKGMDARISSVPNRGYDIGPFVVEVINKERLEEFDYVVKLQTKRNVELMWVNYRPYRGSEWRRELLSFCATKKRIEAALESFAKYDEQGMIASGRMINHCGSDCVPVAATVKKMLENMGLRVRHKTCVSGSIYMLRAELLTCFRDSWNWEDFQIIDPKDAHREYGLAGYLEFLFPMAVSAQGYLVSEGHWCPFLAKVGYVFKDGLYLSLRACSTLVRKIVGDGGVNGLLRLIFRKARA